VPTILTFFSVRSALQANRSEQASPCGLRYVVVWSRPLSTSYAKVKNSCSPCLLLRPRTVVARHRPCVGLAVLFEVRPPTGEPDAGNPPVRFGGRGGPRSPYPYVRLKGCSIREVQVLSRPGSRPVTDDNCVAARRGGEQSEVNDPSVREELDSAGVSGEPASDCAKPRPRGNPGRSSELRRAAKAMLETRRWLETEGSEDRARESGRPAGAENLGGSQSVHSSHEGP
jgi:hypothetical protein